MPIRKDVREVIDLVRTVGLDPVMESGSGHYKVRDPKSGVYLFGISSSPSDPNWRWMIMRHLRRLGLLTKHGKVLSHSERKKQKPAIDLEALKKAQDRAISAGVRPPQLEDLEDSTEFFTRIKHNSSTVYSTQAQEEATNLIMAKANDPKVRYLKQRLRKVLAERNDELVEALKIRLGDNASKVRPGVGAISYLARVAYEDVQPKRPDLDGFPSFSAATQFFNNFQRSDDVGGSVKSLSVLEATLDYVDGLQFGVIDETRKRVVAEPPQSQFQAPPVEISTEPVEPEVVEPRIGPIEIPEEVPAVSEAPTNHIRERYAEALLDILKAEGSAVDEKVLMRLDKLAEIA